MSFIVETDSKGRNFIDFINLSENKYHQVIDILTNRNVNSQEYKIREEAGVVLNWHDENKKSLSIEFKSLNYFNFVAYLNNKMR